MQTELQRSGLDAHACIDHATGHAQRDGNMGILDMFDLAKYHAGLHGMLMNEMLHEHPGTRSGLSIHEAQPMAHQVRKFVNQRCMLLAYHEPLHSPGTRDQFMNPGLEPGLKRFGENRRPSRQ